MPHFKGIISDVGAPTANMYGLRGRDASRCARCSRPSCLFPSRCPNMEHSHRALLELYSRITAVPGVRKAFIGSGIRYDLFLDKDGFLDEYSEKYLREVVTNHTSGWFKVAPEHTEDHVLRLMSKPPFALFSVLEGTGRKQGTQGNTAGAGAGFHPYAHDCILGDVLHGEGLVRTAGFRGKEHLWKENPKISFF